MPANLQGRHVQPNLGLGWPVFPGRSMNLHRRCSSRQDDHFEVSLVCVGTWPRGHFFMIWPTLFLAKAIFHVERTSLQNTYSPTSLLQRLLSLVCWPDRQRPLQRLWTSLVQGQVNKTTLKGLQPRPSGWTCFLANKPFPSKVTWTRFGKNLYISAARRIQETATAPLKCPSLETSGTALDLSARK